MIATGRCWIVFGTYKLWPKQPCIGTSEIDFSVGRSRRMEWRQLVVPVDLVCAVVAHRQTVLAEPEVDFMARDLNQPTASTLSAAEVLSDWQSACRFRIC